MNSCKAEIDLYTILGLQKNCSASEVRNAYRKLAMKWHPDKCAAGDSADQAKTRFQAIHDAYSVLSDDSKRFWYDAELFDSTVKDESGTYGMNDFMGELASLMTETASQSSGGDDFGELRDMFMKIFDDDTCVPVNVQKHASPDTGVRSPSKRSSHGEHFCYAAELGSFQATGFCMGADSDSSSTGIRHGKRRVVRKR